MKQRLREEVAKALYQETQVEATECKQRTPVKTGALRSTVKGTEPVIEAERIYCMIVAGGQSTEFNTWVGYALEVHENVDAIHPIAGEDHYISGPLLESRPFMAQRVAARMKKNGAFK